MDQLHRTRMALVKIYARYSRIEHLLEELVKIGTAFVSHPCSEKQTALVTTLEYAYAKVYVLAKSHLRETFKGIVYIATHSHIEGTRIELVHFLLAATNATGSKE